MSFFSEGDVFGWDWRNSGCDWAHTVPEDSGRSVQTNCTMCVQSSLPGMYLGFIEGIK